jgi:hypothetical protein
LSICCSSLFQTPTSQILTFHKNTCTRRFVVLHYVSTDCRAWMEFWNHNMLLLLLSQIALVCFLKDNFIQIFDPNACSPLL